MQNSRGKIKPAKTKITKPKHRMYCAKSGMRCLVYHSDGICPDVRDCEACKLENQASKGKIDEPHKHKMEIISTENYRLTNADKVMLPVYDEFTFKSCKCGFRQPIKVERKSGKIPKQEVEK